MLTLDSSTILAPDIQSDSVEDVLVPVFANYKVPLLKLQKEEYRVRLDFSERHPAKGDERSPPRRKRQAYDRMSSSL